MKNTLVLCALVLLFFSCQKEIEFDFGRGGTGPGPRDGVLIKAVNNSGSDSVVINYSYDGSKRLLSEKIVGTSQGIDVGTDLRIIRNSAGIISGLVQKSEALLQSGIDSIITRVYYNQGTSRYSSSVSQINIFGITVRDSTVLVYDGTKVLREDIYQTDPLSDAYYLSSKSEYLYSANGNLKSIQQYDLSGGSPNHIGTISYTYDTRVNPLRLNTEAFIIGNPVLMSANNIDKALFEDATDPANNITITNTYTYNSFNKPIKGVSTQNPGNMVSDNTFFYK